MIGSKTLCTLEMFSFSSLFSGEIFFLTMGQNDAFFIIFSSVSSRPIDSLNITLIGNTMGE